MAHYHYIGKTLHNHYVKKYGNNFIENTPKFDKSIYLLHSIISLLLIIIANNFSFYSLVFIYALEIQIIIFLNMHPYFMTVKLFSLPILGMTTYFISSTFLAKITQEPILASNIIYQSSLFSLIATSIFSFILFITYKKKEIYQIENIQNLKNIELKVIEKIPIDYDNSFIIFEGNNNQKYAIKTDLDETFIQDKIYKLNVQNENFIIETIEINKHKTYFIDKIDGSKFEVIK